MLTAAECRAHSDECVTLAKDPRHALPARYDPFCNVEELDRTCLTKGIGMTLS